ncbi:MAG: amidohydrolase family protein [Nitrososphaerota archaeon]|nr:amidohydrolase family protein [Candidatus Calditenuis fumarioli]
MTAPEDLWINDVHIHVNPFSKLKRPAFEFFATNPDFRENWQRIERDPEYLIRRMDEDRVKRAVLINYVAEEVMGYDVSTNQYVYEYCRDHRDRLLPFAGVDVRMAPREFREQLETAYSKYEVEGFKLHPVHQLVYPNQYREEYGERAVRNLETFYQFCSDHGLPVTVHTGTSMFPGARLKYGQPIHLDDVLVDFPRLRLLMAHGGRPFWMDEAFFLMRRHRNLYLDVSGIPPGKLLEYFPRIEEVVDRVLFGSDWPSPGVKGMRENALGIWKLNGLSEEAKLRILVRNFDEFFKR